MGFCRLFSAASVCRPVSVRNAITVTVVGRRASVKSKTRAGEPARHGGQARKESADAGRVFERNRFGNFVGIAATVVGS